MHFISLFPSFLFLFIVTIDCASAYYHSCTPYAECRDVFQCPYFVGLLQNPTIPQHIIIGEVRRRQCGFSVANPAVCCSRKSLTDATLRNHRNLHLLPMDQCGIPWGFRIANGETSRINEAPWMALLFYQTAETIEFFCGGSLISERYVLSAAHCVLKTLIGVRLGEYDILSNEDCDQLTYYCNPPSQDFYIDTIVIPSSFDQKSDHINDIALIRLSGKADISRVNVRPICLPLEGNKNFQHEMFIISGWGSNKTGERSRFLMKAEVPMLPLSLCQKLYANFNLNSKHLCAGGKEEDSCGGDSGGPLTSKMYIGNMPRYTQYGIISFGPVSCGTLGMPGVYTNVVFYMKWILNNLEP
ncbi:phenoloxidase-activating factor 3-like isoform X2 [Harmonia axyridis]|uniref:phenoloxidase-activating factor 3-like isoform X2 n=1 Tax=Harmonia axyridis TaxID=115357 RepID=UPI001E275661|nr:phenoloxidase-activating factor 3-like isoform X2 [Harmonia axyridis]